MANIRMTEEQMEIVNKWKEIIEIFTEKEEIPEEAAKRILKIKLHKFLADCEKLPQVQKPPTRCVFAHYLIRYSAMKEPERIEELFSEVFDFDPCKTSGFIIEEKSKVLAVD